MENTFNNFIKRLKEMFDSNENFYEIIEDLDGNKDTKYSDLAIELECDACKYLIRGNGQINYERKNILEENGFKVYPGDKDSFGWLTGVIERNDRKLVFG